MKKVSDCCGTPAKNEHDEDFGFCPKCRERCQYITEEERERRENATDELKQADEN